MYPLISLILTDEQMHTESFVGAHGRAPEDENNNLTAKTQRAQRQQTAADIVFADGPGVSGTGLKNAYTEVIIDF